MLYMLRFFILILSLVISQTHFIYAKNIHIVTTIKPIQSLIYNIIDSDDSVVALIDNNHSPHHFALKPSHISNLRQSDSVILINPDFETFMKSSFQIIPKTSKILNLSDADNLTVYLTQQYGLSKNTTASTDYHIWLSPDNAIKTVSYIAKELSKINPEKKEIYEKNLKTTIQKLNLLSMDLKTHLRPLKDKPFMVFHNGYGYFIKAYSLNLVGIITDNPAAYSSIKRIKQAQKQLHDNHVACVFKEPQFSSKPIETVIGNANTKIGTLDPLGGTITAGKEHYFTMMRTMSDNLVKCFSE
jgi:zinc transport system substrate-binding protein